MANSRKEKQAIIEKAKQALSGVSALVFVNFHKLSVTDTTSIRRELRARGVGYFVAKKTLLRRALESFSFKGESPKLEGEIAVAYSLTDSLSPAREVYGFEKKFKDSLALAGGVFEGEYQGRERMVALASIPPLTTLYAQFANLLNSPLQGLVIALQAYAGSKTPAEDVQAQ